MFKIFYSGLYTQPTMLKTVATIATPLVAASAKPLMENGIKTLSKMVTQTLENKEGSDKKC